MYKLFYKKFKFKLIIKVHTTKTMDNILIHIKLQNFNKDEDNSKNIWSIEGNTISNQKTNETFNFNSISDENRTYEDFYNSHLKENINNNLSKGCNFCLMTYGQSNYKYKFFRSIDENTGIIFPLAKDIFSFFGQEYKTEIKISIFEIYNEAITDLLDTKKNNIDVKEYEKKLVIDHLTETPLFSMEKLSNIMKIADKSSKLLSESRSSSVNDPSSKYTSNIVKLNLEYYKKNDRKQSGNIQVLLIDFPHSDTINTFKKNDINNTFKRQNLSKGITSFANIVNKITSGQKATYLFKDSKLTKILYQVFNCPFNKIFYSYINPNMDQVYETTSVLNFLTKIKSIGCKKTDVNPNTTNLFEDKSKFLNENMKLKSKIKELENMVSEKEIFSERKVQKIQNSETKKINNEEEEGKNGILTNLEKEVFQLKKILLNNTNMNMSYMDEDGGTPDEGFNNNLEASFHLLNNSTFSAAKTPNYFSMNKLTDSARKYNDNYNPYSNTYSSIFNSNGKQNNSLYSQRRCFTESKGYPNRNISSIPKFLIPQSINFSNHKQGYNSMFNNSSLLNTIPEEMNVHDQEIDNNEYVTNEINQVGATNNNGYLLEIVKERDDLKRQLNEGKRNLIDTTKEKDAKIKSLQNNLTSVSENYDKIIQETEENYSNLKMQFDRIKEENQKKDSNIGNLLQQIRNLESELSLQMSKNSFTPNETVDDLNIRLKEISENLEKTSVNLVQEKERNGNLQCIIEKLKDENFNLKLSYENVNTELIGVSTQKEMFSKNIEMATNENLKMKNDIISYRNEITLNKDKISQQKNEINMLKSEISKLKNEKLDTKNSKIITEIQQCLECPEREKKILKLEDNLKTIESKLEQKTQRIKELEFSVSSVKEYERLIEESLIKLKEQENNLLLTREKNKYLENLLSRFEFKIDDENTSKKKVVTTPNAKNSATKSINLSAFTPYEEEQYEDTINITSSTKKKQTSIIPQTPKCFKLKEYRNIDKSTHGK